MAENKGSENTKSWQKFLAPLVAALIAAAGSYYKSHTEINASHDREVAERAEIKLMVSNDHDEILAIKADNTLMKNTLYNISNDVSFIRGKLEGKK